MRKLLLFIPLIFAACKKNEPPKPLMQHVVVPDMEHCIRDTTGNFMEFSCDYYGNHNLIVDDSSKIYYYPYGFFPSACGTDKDYSRPNFINLEPHQLIELDETIIDNFAELNLSSKTDYTKLIMVASAKDTFQSKAIDSLLSKAFRNKGHTLFIVRRLTEEEKIVLKHKKSGDRFYSPSDIKWDTTKTKFWPKDMEVLR